MRYSKCRWCGIELNGKPRFMVLIKRYGYHNYDKPVRILKNGLCSARCHWAFVKRSYMVAGMSEDEAEAELRKGGFEIDGRYPVPSKDCEAYFIYLGIQIKEYLAYKGKGGEDGLLKIYR